VLEVKQDASITCAHSSQRFPVEATHVRYGHIMSRTIKCFHPGEPLATVQATHRRQCLVYKLFPVISKSGRGAAAGFSPKLGGGASSDNVTLVSAESKTPPKIRAKAAISIRRSFSFRKNEEKRAKVVNEQKQLWCRKRASKLCVPESVSWDLKSVFRKGNAPGKKDCCGQI
jgi:hypothetical protein